MGNPTNTKKRCTLLSLFIAFNILTQNVVTADKARFSRLRSPQQYGIFPRGGAVKKKYTDVLQFAPKGRKESVNQKASSSASIPTSSSPAFRRRNIYTRSTRRKPVNGEAVVDVSTISRPQPTSSYNEYNSPMSNELDQITDFAEEILHDSTVQDSDSGSRLPYILSRKEYIAPSKTKHVPSSTDSSLMEENVDAVSTKSNPIIYRYFGRSRARSSRSDSVSFIVLGPSADHWRAVGKILAARGFNVIVCERTKEQKNEDEFAEDNGASKGELLTEAVLDALKWQKAILVGCDEDAVLAMEGALKLAPDRVAGLVLCGDLSRLKTHIEKEVVAIREHDPSFASSSDFTDEDVSVDNFVQDYIDCPSCIIWDGDASSWSTSNSDFSSSVVSLSNVKGSDGGSRNVIIGGGLAPHRRLPEQFAWTLTRFVENRVSSQTNSPYNQNNGIGNELTVMEQLELDSTQTSGSRGFDRGAWRDILPPRVTKKLDEILAPGSLLVAGRVVATAIIYMSITKASMFQYHNIRDIRSAILNPDNMKKLLALPGMLLRRRRQNMNDLSSTGAQIPKDLTLEKMLPDTIDENDKLEKMQTESLESTAEEEDGNDEHDEDNSKAPSDHEITGENPSFFPKPSNPFALPTPKDTPKPHEPENDNNEDFLRREPAEKNLLHKFMFFDQIIS